MSALPQSVPAAPANARAFDLENLPAGFYDDPYPHYAALRRDEPVKQLPNGAYLLTRYADLARVYKDPKAFSSDKKIEFSAKYGDGALFRHHTTSLVFNDPPLHTRVRKLIIGALSARAIAEMAPSVEALVESLLAAMPARAEVDLIEDFAAAIPVEVIGNLLGVPRDERGHLRRWSLAILGALEPVVAPEAMALGDCAVEEFCAYLETLVDRRRQHPGDPERDVLTRLLVGESDEGRLSMDELLHNCIFLLNAGHETTTNLIGNALVLLARHPQERERLLSNPSGIATAVEEVLRFESSNQLGNRLSMADAIFGGVTVPAGSRITLCIGAANRDPEQFPDAERFDVARTPNRHLAFATGPHQCAGMMLARLEASVALSRLLARFPNFALAGEPVRARRVRFRGFVRVPALMQAQTCP